MSAEEQPTTTAPPAPEAASAPAPTAPAPQSTETDTPAQAQTEPKSEGEDASKTQQQPAAEEKPAPLQELWATAQAHEHPEIWGVTLADPSTHIPSQIVLQKYLNANDGDLAKARDQLVKTLDWRKKTQPLELIKQTFSQEKFGALGYVTVHSNEGAEDGDAKEAAQEVFTWNVYGNVKSIDVTFGDLEEFIKWRVALMELAVQKLSLATATAPIGSDPDADPFKMFQVHDYKGVSFLRQAPQVKAASTETIRVFATAYPELLKEKFFVNVPAVMGFMYGFMKLFVAARTIKKFHPLSNGGNLAKESFGGSKVALGQMLPPEYGGKGAELKAQGIEPAVAATTTTATTTSE
ncbi:putative phosphatidylinositol transfer protein SFH5 [Rosellinia necatrix]|uniref:Phosphatidylinositol transfer protein SFH5 n=1 Tax=Rosellinia necatrix TaxID=77044 RepID=A0A1W2TSV2_ROSNE|nr:putative phosphatidylinositol transfer protein SFH5 [Rosellinia necatrix]